MIELGIQNNLGNVYFGSCVELNAHSLCVACPENLMRVCALLEWKFYFKHAALRPFLGYTGMLEAWMVEKHAGVSTGSSYVRVHLQICAKLGDPCRTRTKASLIPLAHPPYTQFAVSDAEE
jgi:hypothetical protein